MNSGLITHQHIGHTEGYLGLKSRPKGIDPVIPGLEVLHLILYTAAAAICHNGNIFKRSVFPSL